MNSRKTMKQNFSTGAQGKILPHGQNVGNFLADMAGS